MTDIHRIKDVYGFTNEDIAEEISYEIAETEEKDLRELKLMKSSMIIYSPKVFERIRTKDESVVNLYESFDPISN